MKCSEIHKDLIFYIEGSLDSSLDSKIKEHLSDCEDCRGFVNKLRLTYAIIDEEREHKPDSEFFQRITSRMEADSKFTIGPVIRIFRTAVAAAVIVFGIFSGVNIARLSSDSIVVDSGFELSEEFYSLNDLYKEPIENFFLLKDYRDE